uniref:Uncharacterized protein n=1 Tax=Acrobeloides nanus TaxID=290746 RepID=A0A914CWL1_9BILA
MSIYANSLIDFWLPRTKQLISLIQLSGNCSISEPCAVSVTEFIQKEALSISLVHVFVYDACEKNKRLCCLKRLITKL